MTLLSANLPALSQTTGGLAQAARAPLQQQCLCSRARRSWLEVFLLFWPQLSTNHRCPSRHQYSLSKGVST